MSDMLQLVVNCRRKSLSLHNDKLMKHIGQQDARLPLVGGADGR